MSDCKNSCEYCKFVNRGYDEDSHGVHWISDRCPFNKEVILFRAMNCDLLPLEFTTRYTGCVRFEEDEDYRRFNEELAETLRKLDEGRERKQHDAVQGS